VIETEIDIRADCGGVTLRPYQRDAVDAVFKEWNEVQSTLVVMPTGTGKSIVFSEVMRKWMEENR
jgi:superfamily II DNA or RNA helicase